jgi:hypothetical protein
MIRSVVRNELSQTIEPKVTESTQSVAVSYAGAVVSLTGNLARGDLAVDNFQGNVIKVTRVRLSVSWATNQTFNLCRFICFQWNDASTPTPATVLAYVGSAYAPQSQFLWAAKPLLRIFYDEIVALKPRVTSGYDVSIDTRVIGGFAPIKFASGSTAVQKNGIYVLYISDDAVVTYPQLTFTSEVIFTDA